MTLTLPSKVGSTHLISAGTWSEAFIREVELLHAEGACLFLVIVDELVLLELRHCGSDETRDGWRRRVVESAPGTACSDGEARMMVDGMESARCWRRRS